MRGSAVKAAAFPAVGTGGCQLAAGLLHLLRAEGARAARESIARRLGAGLTLEQIRQHEHYHAAWLCSRAITATDLAFSRAYAYTADLIVSDLRSRQEPERGPMAASLPPGTPHPDPVLAAKGWHVDGGIYIRTQHARRSEAA
jgi:hypothetical protein